MPQSDEYTAYIRSAAWKRKRDDLIARAGYVCQKCGSSGFGAVRLQVHHLSYERLGQEKPEDLVVLCEDCHKEADQERKLRSSDRKWDRRVSGFAYRKYGIQELSDYEFDTISSELEEYLDRQDE